MRNLNDIALASVQRFKMLPDNAPVVAMVSGGGDSMTLLEMLASGALGAVRLCVLHVNHMLRGNDAEGDERAVVERCETLGVACRVVRYDVAALAEAQGLNLEDAGRQVRYRFANDELDAWCDSLGARRDAGRIATGHTRDDRVETFFVRALTGAGPGAFASIAAVRDRIIRPLIDCDRSEVRAWLESMGRPWREDASNSDTRRLRALVRASIIPVAEQVNPAFRETLARSMDLMADDDALLSGMAGAFARDFVEVVPGVHAAFNRSWMGTLDRTMARRTVRAALAAAFPEAGRIEASHIEALVDGLAQDSFARDLPSGLRAFTEYDNMMLLRSDIEPHVVAPGLLSLPGNLALGAAGSIGAEAAESGDVSGTPDSVVIDADKVGGELVVDGPREGDRMRPFGMDGTRKISDLLIDAKVPKRARNAVPVVRDGDRIVWLAGVRSSEDYRVSESTKRPFRLTWCRESDIEDPATNREGI